VGQTDARGAVTTLAYDDLDRVTVKTVTAPGLAAETTANTYDETTANGHSGFFNVGKLTDASRNVAAQTLAGNIVLPAVGALRRYDYDASGRLVRERHVGLAGSDRTLGSDYYANGQLRRKQLADGTWTGDYAYDQAGRLLAIDNGAQPSGSEPDLFIASILYNARGQATSVAYGNG
jgi:YD repeat-containing protein